MKEKIKLTCLVLITLAVLVGVGFYCQEETLEMIYLVSIGIFIGLGIALLVYCRGQEGRKKE